VSRTRCNFIHADIIERLRSRRRIFNLSTHAEAKQAQQHQSPSTGQCYSSAYTNNDFGVRSAERTRFRKVYRAVGEVTAAAVRGMYRLQVHDNIIIILVLLLLLLLLLYMNRPTEPDEVMTTTAHRVQSTSVFRP